jgi:CheY-like chemotaxis protein
MLKILAQILAGEGGFTVVGAATNGRQALHYVSTLLPDLILMDFNMPYMDGAKTTQFIKQFAKPPIVFMVTSDDSSNSRSMSQAAGADAFIVKSEDLCAQLRSKLKEWFGEAGNQRKGP